MFVKVRRIMPEDVNSLLPLAKEIREHHREILNGYFMPQNNAMEREIIAKWVSDDKNICLLAEEENEILGILLCEFKYSPYLELPNTMVVHNFGVCEKAQRRGIGRLLMDELYCECQARDIKEIKLGVFNKNITAYEFYENYGFEPQEQKMSLKIK